MTMITFNDNTLEIKDELKSQYWILYIICALNLISALCYLSAIHKTGVGIKEMIFMCIGFFSIMMLYILIFMHSTAKSIPIENIMRLNRKSIFGVNRYSLQLKNGKKRSLIQFTSQEDINDLRKTLSKIGIVN